MSKNIINGALDMAKLGYHVFPLLKRLQKGNNSRGTPKGWNHNSKDPKSIPSTMDQSKIADWLEDYTDIIGYGVNPRNRRAVVLDVDVKDGKKGGDSLRALVKDFGLSTNTFCVRTQSGGLHLYYSYDGIPEGFYVKGTGIDGYPDIDLRCDNSFLNGPAENTKYQVIKNLPTSPLPSELIVLLPLQTTKKISKLIADAKSAESLIYGDDSLKGMMPDKIFKGERDNTLIRLIGSWARKYPIDTTLILLKEAISRCEGRITIEDYIPKVESTYEKANFRPLAPDMVEWMEDHLILIPERKSICDLSQAAHKSIVIKDAAIDRFKNWIYYLEDANTGKKRKLYAFSTWMESPKRQDVKSYGYYPSSERTYYCDIQDTTVANTYSGPFKEFTPAKDLSEYDKYIEKFENFCRLLFVEDTEFMLDWVAHQIQKPHQKLTIAPVMISPVRGVGKNLFFDIVKNLVGKWNATEADVSEAIDKFCEFPIKHHLVLINEANVDVRDKRGINTRREMLEKLKTKVTENTQTVEPKYIGRFNIKSYINYIVAGNMMDGLPVEEGDRRFHVMKILAGKQPRKYYDDLWALTRSPVEDSDVLNKAYAVRLHFKNRKITQLFKGDVARMSEAKQEMIDANKSYEQENIEDAVKYRKSIFRSSIITKELFEWYISNKMYNGHRLSTGAIRDLFRYNFQAIKYEEGSRRAKQLRVMQPDREVNGNMISGEYSKSSLFLVRQSEPIRNHRTTWLKALYDKAFEATNYNYIEEDEDDSKREKSI